MSIAMALPVEAVGCRQVRQLANRHQPAVAGAAVSLPQRLRQCIERRGPLPFADWMEACLYDPDGGYYMRPGRKTGAGPDADFATGPTLHPFIGIAVAEEVRDVWRKAGRPGALRVVEFGGGEGDLARHALTHLDEEEAPLAQALEWVHVEASPVHRDLQESADLRVRHAHDMPDTPVGVVVAHEFVDALPFQWLEWDGGQWREVQVGLEGDRFQVQIGRPVVPDPALLPDVDPEVGQRIVTMAQAREWLRSVGHRLGRGAVVIVDYGAASRWLWTPDRPDGTVRGFRRQRLHDVVSAPGETDITASVDFTLVQGWAEEVGLVPERLETQGAWLTRHGALAHLAGSDKDTLEEAKAYLRLKQLVLPTGIGDAFQVLRLGTGDG